MFEIAAPQEDFHSRLSPNRKEGRVVPEMGRAGGRRGQRGVIVITPFPLCRAAGMQ